MMGWIRSEKLGEALVAAGVIPSVENVTRIVIDARAGSLVSVQVEYVGDSKLVDVVPSALMEVQE